MIYKLAIKKVRPPQPAYRIVAAHIFIFYIYSIALAHNFIFFTGLQLQVANNIMQQLFTQTDSIRLGEKALRCARSPYSSSKHFSFSLRKFRTVSELYFVQFGYLT